MDPERARAELRRLLEELPEDRKTTWRSTVEDLGDAFGACKAENRDLRAAAELADAIRESTTALGEAGAVLRETKTELARRIMVPDAATMARIGAAVAAVVTPLAAAIAYFASGGATGTLPGVDP